jgi:hypothetical protein
MALIADTDVHVTVMNDEIPSCTEGLRFVMPKLMPFMVVNADAVCAVLGDRNLHIQHYITGVLTKRANKRFGGDRLASHLERMGASKVNACRSLPTTAPIVVSSVDGSPDRPRGEAHTSTETDVQLAEEHVWSASMAIEAVTSTAPKLSPCNDNRAPPLSGALGAATYVTTGPSYERR